MPSTRSSSEIRGIPRPSWDHSIKPEHRDSIERAIAAAVANGATIVAGGDRPRLETGWYLNPTVITDVDNQADIARRELFGPVTVVMPYDTVNEAVRIANDSPYTLAAYLYGGSLEQCMDISSVLRAGVVTINGGGGFRPDAPQGGFGRRSGFGREMGDLGIKEYLYSQHVQWAMRSTGYHEVADWTRCAVYSLRPGPAICRPDARRGRRPLDLKRRVRRWLGRVDEPARRQRGNLPPSTVAKVPRDHRTIDHRPSTPVLAARRGRWAASRPAV